MKHGHLTEQRKHFVEAYCRLGNGTLAAKDAGYKDSPSIVSQERNLSKQFLSHWENNIYP